uniref:Beta-ketoacyl-[acyl-carrier-protein] synthase III n=1 Tax=Synarthrophyton chejuense TaxID=2485825 RepID=A0A3G3MFR4_9FLOR|nr:3-oxoacyl-acyl-carrier-protein synthase 3 [Synarthrophyton chejuense]AYR05660.1 3-oxoacyl-acyl-carrier-protein synthase 3 [Synarthrophyton chejuense]
MKSSIRQGVKLLATGSAVPDLCISNDLISDIVDTSDEWIFNRTGIKERRISSSPTSLIDMAAKASMQALDKTQINTLDLDLIILATSTPNDLFGSASQLQAKIGASKAIAFDITAACSGFVIAMVTATQFIQNGSYANVLVVGADVLSKWTNWSDRRTCILFGDGAGAAILQSCSTVKNNILGFHLNTDGQKFDQLNISCEYSNFSDKCIYPGLRGNFKHITMHGKEVYKFAVSKVPQSIQSCLNSLNLSSESVDWLLLHQANNRILNAVASRLMIPAEKVISNLSKYGNTSAASIPLALNEALEDKKIKNGDLIVMSGFGAGLTWGTLIFRWYG